jgi:hypothetical protein
MIALGHPASLARASSCNQTSLAIQSSMVCTEQARSLTFHEIEPIVMVSPQIGGGEGMLGGDLQRAEEGSSYCVQRSWRLEARLTRYRGAPHGRGTGGKREELARSFW